MEGGTTIDVGALFDAHGTAVLAFAHRMLGDRREAEDAVQDTFLRAHRAAATFRGDTATPTTWLFAIARNVCLDRLRARVPRQFSTLEEVVATGARDGVVPPGTPSHAAADVLAQRREYVAAVREGCLAGTLACLTADQRAAFVLRTLCDLDVADTAAVLGRTPNAVRVLTHRARARLTAFLCRHCSLWDAANPCRCENLVNLSLARGWLGAADRRPDVAAARVERAAAVIEGVARLAELYRLLEPPSLRADAAARLRTALADLGGGPASS